jgi:hypothetical protein
VALTPAGCSSLIAYCGQDVEKLATKDQVRKSFGAPDGLGDADGREFDEFRTRRKVSEPTVAGVNFILGAETLGLLELWNFPVAVVRNSWVTVFGQTLRFEYGSDGRVERVYINDTLMEHRASLP